MKRTQLIGAGAVALAMAGVWPGLAQARRLELLLSGAADAETPEHVIQAQTAGEATLSPIAAAISASGASAVEYLLPERAQGDFALRLKSNPADPRAQLERYLVLTYAEQSDLATAMKQLSSTAGVDAVFESTPVDFFDARNGSASAKDIGTQYHLNALRIPQAWYWNGGYGVVGFLDSGVEIDHADLRAFDSGGHFTGGNLLSVFSLDLGAQLQPSGAGWVWDYNHIDLNPDEAQPVPANLPACDFDGDGYMTPRTAGHGTHVAGIVGANASNGDATQGVCEHCGLGMIKTTSHYCFTSGIPAVYSQFPDTATISRALTIAVDGTGDQIINMSFGSSLATANNLCPPTGQSQPALCLAIQHAVDKDIMLVAASGNSRTKIQYPARDPRVVAVGGLNESLGFWDEGINGLQNCPAPNNPAECGSNYSIPADIAVGVRQELVAPAKNVISTMYHGMDWNPSCGDSTWGFTSDGVGACTGTSMSAPMVAGIAGLLRSTNPLVPVGKNIPTSQIGIRDVLRLTTDRGQAWLPWDAKLGYGRPDAERAVQRMLGSIGYGAVNNRLTPLFRLYGANASDYGFVTSPQVAVSMMINGAAPYVPSGIVTPGYGSFPGGVSGSPRATAYVLTTPATRAANSPPTVPLYLIDRERPSPAGCTPGNAGCNSFNRDWSVAAGSADLEARVAQGYAYRGIQGYIFARCSGRIECVQPTGAEALYRKCKSSDDDCAVFLERDRIAMQALGFVTVQGLPADGVLGYAFPNVDSDGDTLIDGFEYLLGTSPTNVDSDSDGCGDGAEYPPAGVPTGNPLSPPDFVDC